MNRTAKKIGSILIMAGGVLWATSCQFFNKEDSEQKDGQPLARVYNRYLYESDIKDLVPRDLSGKDSIAFLQNYINVWAKDQLMIYKAEYNLTENKKNFDKQIEEYRNDLLKFAYRQEYVAQNLDTNISDTAIQHSYNKEGSSFILKENIVQADYLIINKDAPNIQEAIKWFNSDKQKDRDKLYDYALKYAYKFALDDSSWVSFDQLRKIIPFEGSDQQNIVKNNQPVQFKDDTNVYLVQIHQYKLKGGQAPLPYARDIIRNVLLNKRKLKLLENLEQNLLKDAVKKKEFEVY